MRFFAIILSCAFLFGLPQAARADQTEAREVARINNCPPKKIDVYQQSLGSEGKTIYRVECTMPKTTDASSTTPQASALLISCDESLCELLRPVAGEEKK